MECGQENPVLTFIQSEVLTKSRHGRSNRQKHEILLCKKANKPIKSVVAKDLSRVFALKQKQIVALF